VKYFIVLTLKIHEKDEDEMNEKNENANCLRDEPLITADQVSLTEQMCCTDIKKKKKPG